MDRTLVPRPSTRCLQLTKFYPPINGGIETTVRDIAEGLKARNWSVDVLCSNIARKTVEEFDCIKVTRVSSWGNIAKTSITPSLVFRLLRSQRQSDVIHVHMPNPMANLALWLTRPDTKIVVHWHSDIVRQQRLLKLYAPLQAWLLRRADAIVATSARYAESSPWLRPYMNKVHISPSCIRDPDDRIDEPARTKVKNTVRVAHSDKRIIFALGRMTHYKGFNILIEAAQYIPENTVILLGGDGELLRELKSQAEILGVNKKIEFLGRIADEDLPGYYAVSDVFCLPSLIRSEAFGLVMVEAMSHSKPVVSTNIPGSGVPWVNVHGVTGLNAEPGNARDLADKLCELLSDQHKARRMGEAGRLRFEENFTINKMIESIINVFAHIGVISKQVTDHPKV